MCLMSPQPQRDQRRQSWRETPAQVPPGTSAVICPNPPREPRGPGSPAAGSRSPHQMGRRRVPVPGPWTPARREAAQGWHQALPALWVGVAHLRVALSSGLVPTPPPPRSMCSAKPSCPDALATVRMGLEHCRAGRLSAPRDPGGAGAWALGPERAQTPVAWKSTWEGGLSARSCLGRSRGLGAPTAPSLRP